MFDFLNEDSFGFFNESKSDSENADVKRKMSHNKETISLITTMAGCTTALMVMGLTVKRVYDAFNE